MFLTLLCGILTYIWEISLFHWMRLVLFKELWIGNYLKPVHYLYKLNSQSFLRYPRAIILAPICWAFRTVLIN